MIEIYEKIKIEVETFFFDYLTDYFNKRDLSKTLSYLDSGFNGFGTGLDENLKQWNDVTNLYQRDIEEAPSRIEFEINYLNINIPNENTGIVSSIFSINTTIVEQMISINNLRLSLVCNRYEDTWKIAHMHISLPTTEHCGDEAYPIKELEERNQVLQKMVDHKTSELKKANDELQNKLDEIKTLSGLIPICASCKKIRDDKGYWNNLEKYIMTHTNAEFSHGICPDCVRKLYPNFSKNKDFS